MSSTLYGMLHAINKKETKEFIDKNFSGDRSMSLHNGVALFAKTIHLWEEENQTQLDLTDGEMLVWAGSGALAIGRQLAATIRAGERRNILHTDEEGHVSEVHIGPDVTIVHEEGSYELQKY